DVAASLEAHTVLAPAGVHRGLLAIGGDDDDGRGLGAGHALARELRVLPVFGGHRIAGLHRVPDPVERLPRRRVRPVRPVVAGWAHVVFRGARSAGCEQEKSKSGERSRKTSTCFSLESGEPAHAIVVSNTGPANHPTTTLRLSR